MKILLNKKVSTTVLTVSFVVFSILSWWLLFRDERALSAFESFYPALGGQLFSIRNLLLKFGLNVIPTLAFAVTGLFAFLAYFVSLKLNFSLQRSIALALVFQAIVFLSYPVLSTDVFSYIFGNRVLSEYGQNVWKTSPNNFPDDAFEQLADWKDQPSAYGLVNHLIYLPADLLGSDNLIPTVLLYKVVAVIFGLGTILVVLKILNQESESEKALIIRTIFWNPLLVLEFFGSAHNDILMFFFLGLGILGWKKKWWLSVGMFLAFAVQVKLLAIFATAFLGLKLLQDKNIRGLFKFTFSFAVINLIAFAVMNINPLDFLKRIAFNNTVYWQSLPSLFEKFMPNFNMPFSLIFLMVILGLAIIQIQKKWDPLKTSAIALLLYVSFFTTAYWNWYILWPFMLAVFVKNRKLKKIILLTTMTSLMAYPVLWLSHRYSFGNPIWNIFTYLMIFGVPPVVVFINNFEKLRAFPLLGDRSRLYYGTFLKSR